MDVLLTQVMDPSEQRRRRAYRIAVAVSFALIGLGSFFYLSQEIVQFVQAIGEEWGQPEVGRAVSELTDLGEETATEFQTEVKPGIQAVVNEMSAQIQETAYEEEKSGD